MRARRKLLLAELLIATAMLGQSRETSALRGRVVDPAGNGIGDATVIASGGGFSGWATTESDGAFQVKSAGSFVSVRLAGWQTRLIRKSELPAQAVIVLEPAGDSNLRMPACTAAARPKQKWIGGGPKVNPGKSSSRGPVNGQHDAHWYVREAKHVLHIASGPFWHAGLPPERVLESSGPIMVRTWESNGTVFVDLSGRAKNGLRWRWLGPSISDVIEYSDAPDEVAQTFDSIMSTVCFGEP